MAEKTLTKKDLEQIFRGFEKGDVTVMLQLKVRDCFQSLRRFRFDNSLFLK